jgi:hypothetical protein
MQRGGLVRSHAVHRRQFRKILPKRATITYRDFHLARLGQRKIVDMGQTRVQHSLQLGMAGGQRVETD